MAEALKGILANQPIVIDNGTGRLDNKYIVNVVFCKLYFFFFVLYQYEWYILLLLRSPHSVIVVRHHFGSKVLRVSRCLGVK